MADFDTIKQEINVNIPDNNSQYITAKKVRDTLLDMIDDVDEAKQDTLVSGTNIKTINGYTLLGSGNIVIEGGGDLSGYVSKEELSNMGYVTSNYLSQAGYVTNEYLSQASYVTSSDLSQASYVTQTELSNAGYLTSVPSEYVTESEIAAMGYVTETELSNMSYATTSQLSGKQDTLVSGTNIKTINNESLLGSGNIVIEGGGDLSAYVSKEELSNMGYVTSTALTNMSYATTSDLNNAISGIDIPTYTSDLTNDSGFITASDLSGYATETYVADYVATYAPTPDLSAYVTKTELSNAGYITVSDVSQMGYITASDLPDMSSYATLTYLETYYATLQNVSDTADAMQQVLIDANVLVADPETGDWTTQAMASETYVADYVSEHAPMPDLSAYVTKTELSNASYVTSSALSNMSYATTSQLADKQDTLVSGTNIKTVNNNSLLGSGNISITSSGNLISEVTQAEYDAMEQAGTLDPDTIYVITDAAPTDLSYYVTKTELSNAGYLTSIPNTYATYAAISNMGYLTSANFIYNSSTNTLTISI